MCTVVVRVPPTDSSEPVWFLAVRDEDPSRSWDPLGAWWPERPDVVGVRDQRTGGAWLAAEPDAGRLAVVLNREGTPDLPEEQILSRGRLPFDALARDPSGRPLRELDARERAALDAMPFDGAKRMRGFNVVKIAAGAAAVTSWDGSALRTETLAPGTHMVAHHDVDDPRTDRIVAWREAFADAPFEEWPDVLARTAEVDPGDDRAIVRDNRPHGYPTQSTIVCVARVWPDRADVRYAELAQPGTWSPLRFVDSTTTAPPASSR